MQHPMLRAPSPVPFVRQVCLCDDPDDEYHQQLFLAVVETDTQRTVYCKVPKFSEGFDSAPSDVFTSTRSRSMSVRVMPAVALLQFFFHTPANVPTTQSTEIVLLNEHMKVYAIDFLHTNCKDREDRPLIFGYDRWKSAYYSKMRMYVLSHRVASEMKAPGYPLQIHTNGYTYELCEVKAVRSWNSATSNTRYSFKYIFESTSDVTKLTYELVFSDVQDDARMRALG
ncbi:hypothetical protein CYMTET_55093 [Cymbomonas tetramitiformis]|uniref:Uncharacterized protein n=1 Tax=Cymbomonas tetramitiformis TaxID=36881 RepID=A0AAE0BDS0_9CHLO|nr:hypothetical protein CYMTET_55093 [Cymbomonas tetramitiformis]